VTPAGAVTTLAGLAGFSGSANGTGSAARFYAPYGVAVDTNGNVFVADSNNNTIRKVTPAGVVTTLAGLAGNFGSTDGTGSAASFDYPDGLAVDSAGNIYVADTYNNTIRKVTPAGAVTTLAGLAGSSGSADGTGSAARFYAPYKVAVDTNGIVYAVDSDNHTVRKGTLALVVQTTANPTNGTVPLTVQFTSASSDNAGNAITNWNWAFGDGSTSTLQNPSHTYTAEGAFLPSLTASNSLGSAVVGLVTSVAASLPTVQVTANPTSGTVPLTVHFTAASTDSSGHAITNWNWSFGDGSTSTLQNPSHTYMTAGYFGPILTATNDVGVAPFSGLPSISASLPTLSFTANPAGGAVPLFVQFNSPGVDSVGNAITNWSWTFGDSSTSTAQSPSHTYEVGGKFQPSLVVTNNNGTQLVASGPAIAAAVYSGQVLNGGFETGSFFGWNLNALGGLYNLVDTFGQSTEGIEPHTGSYFARLGQPGSLGYLSQTLATTAGANYLLSFWLNSPDGQTPNQFQVSWKGAVLYSRSNLPALGWTNLQFVIAATGSATVLQFGFLDNPTALGLDDISVVQISPTITLQPQSQTVACHSNAQFTVAAAGPPPLHYQWRKNGAPLAGATDTAYSVTPLTCQGSDSYSVVVTNSGGSITSAVATLTVLDNNPPVVICPTNLLRNTDSGQCSAVVTFSVAATDDCAVVSLNINPPSGSTFPKGTNVVNCVAVDCGGNSNTCTFTVTVLDHEPPVLTCPTNQSVACNSTNGAQVFYSATATDNCDGTVPVVFTPPSGSYFSLGTNIVAGVATDSSGNSNTCTFTITVQETTLINFALSGTNLILSWPQSCSTYSVQQRWSLDPLVDWLPLDARPVLSNGQFTIALPMGRGNQYFRLTTGGTNLFGRTLAQWQELYWRWVYAEISIALDGNGNAVTNGNVVLMPLPNALGDGTPASTNVTITAGQAFALPLWNLLGNAYNDSSSDPPIDLNVFQTLDLRLTLDGVTLIDGGNLMQFYSQFYFAPPIPYNVPPAVSFIYLQGIGMVHGPLSPGNHILKLDAKNTDTADLFGLTFEYHNTWNVSVQP
jgi:PKD repeat protein